eukprot:scaffold18139_cov27-Prasinocladus_malaysianus.AAC.1
MPEPLLRTAGLRVWNKACSSCVQSLNSNEVVQWQTPKRWTFTECSQKDGLWTCALLDHGDIFRDCT